MKRDHNYLRPSLHTQNAQCRMAAITRKPRSIRLETFLLLIGLLSLGYYECSISNRCLYQAYENSAFDQKIGTLQRDVCGLLGRTNAVWLAGRHEICRPDCDDPDCSALSTKQNPDARSRRIVGQTRNQPIETESRNDSQDFEFFGAGRAAAKNFPLSTVESLRPYPSCTLI